MEIAPDAKLARNDRNRVDVTSRGWAFSAYQLRKYACGTRRKIPQKKQQEQSNALPRRRNACAAIAHCTSGPAASTDGQPKTRATHRQRQPSSGTQG